MKAQMTELHKIIQIRENLYQGLKKYADSLGLTVEEYAELLLENTYIRKKKACICKKKKATSISRATSDI
jgi:hypothetical protein